MSSFSKLCLKDSQIVEFSMSTDLALLEQNEGKPHAKKIEIGFDHFIEKQSGDSPDICQVNLRVEFKAYSGDDQQEGTLNNNSIFFTIEVSLRGLVEGNLGKSMLKEQREKCLTAFAVNTLFGEAKTYISMMSSSSPYGKLMIPELNVEEAVKASITEQNKHI